MSYIHKVHRNKKTCVKREKTMIEKSIDRILVQRKNV